MNVLGVSAMHSDSAAALVVGGRLVAAASEKRFTRQSGENSVPVYSMEYCLGEGGISAQDLDLVVYHEEPHSRFSRVFSCTLGAAIPSGMSPFVRTMKRWMESMLWVRNEISAKLDLHPDLVELIPHHLGHMANAFLTSPFQEAAILIVDGQGEWPCTTLGKGTRSPSVDIVASEHLSYPHSLGLVRRSVATFLGFRQDEMAHSLDNLALCGKPKRADALREILVENDDRSYQVKPGWFRFERLESPPFRKPWTEQFESVFGPPRDVREPWSLPNGESQEPLAKERDQELADLAASLQEVIAERVLALCERLQEATASSQICIGGEVAADPDLIRRIQDSGLFESVFVPPDAGDAGNALGAALYGATSRNQPVTCGVWPFLGRAYDANQAAQTAAQMRPAAWRRFRMPTSRPDTSRIAVEHEAHCDDSALFAACVEALESGAAMGWHQGRFSCADSNLGERAILAAPQHPDTLRQVTERITGKLPFSRPSLAIATEDAAQVLVDPPIDTPWNQTRSTVHPAARSDLGACVAPDGRCVPLLCSPERHPRLHGLLKAWGSRQKHPALALFGLEERGYPLAASPSDALLLFARSELAFLVVDHILIKKVTT